MPPYQAIAMAIYLAVALACTAAALGARRRSAHDAEVFGWFGCAAFFIGLAALRLFEVEERTRAALRLLARTAGAYDGRAAVQLPLTVMTLAALLLAALFIRRVLRRGNSTRAGWALRLALLGAAGFIPLHFLRIISWHATDALLYGGGVHLNWLIDLGLAAFAGGAALLSFGLRMKAETRR